jgi:hypothetical protein
MRFDPNALVIRRMARGHVYPDAAWLTPGRSVSRGGDPRTGS